MRSTGPLALVLLLLCAGTAAAQITGQGVRGGVNISTLNTSDDESGESADWHVRGVAGGYLTWRMFSWLELQPEVLYSLKGAKVEEGDVTAKALLDYLEVPILARISRGAPGTRRFYGVAGIALGVLLRAKTRADFGGATEEIDIKDDIETLDLGAVVGGGMEFGSLVIDARYTHGIRDIDKDTTDSVTVKTRAASITVGIRF
jgi:hypothetical protein